MGILEYFFLLSIYNSISTITIDNSLLLQANWLQQNTGLISLVSVVVAIIFFFLRTFDEKKKLKEEVNERIIRICSEILNDVQDIENDLVNGKSQIEIDEKGNEFFLGYLSTFICESITYVTNILIKTYSFRYFRNLKLGSSL